ncbi:MAG: glycosyltransferase, partial [Alphaproteobacteria bacterium]
MPKISIIIPVYNVEKYLSQCLDSVLNQTFNDWEAICVNDGSTDKSAEILTKYANKDSRIKVINQENYGVSSARNTAMKRITGEWTCFLDADDAFAPCTLETFYNIALKSKQDVVVCDTHVCDISKLPALPIISYVIKNNALKNIVSIPNAQSTLWNKLIKTELVKKQEFINGISTGDWPFITVLFNDVQSFALTHSSLYFYNQENTSITRSPFSVKKIKSYMAGIEYVYNFYIDKPNLKYAKKRIATAIKMCVNKTYRDKKNRK